MSQGKQIFDNRDAKQLFVECYEEFGEEEFYQNMFGELIRRKADEKVTSLEDLETFYLTKDDVYECHEKVMLEKDMRDGVKKEEVKP